MLPEGVFKHPINKAKKRKLFISVWDFEATYPQGERKHYLFNNHPAKMRPPLARAILQIYGESPVLDPMSGIGTTCVEASLLGMDSYGLEYERKFVEQARKNIRHLRRLFPDKKLGRAGIIKGDARFISQIFRKANSIVFSPPYLNAIKKGGEGPGADNNKISYRESIKRFQGYSADKGNIGNTGRYGFFNSIVFSPPYSESIGHVAGKNASEKYPWRLKQQRKMTETWSRGNIAKLKHGNENLFNSIVFSPPYGEANKGGGIAKNGYEGRHGKDVDLKNRCDRPISGDSNNIGNFLYGKTYLSEMFKIYSECYKVLRPGKFMVVVVKDIRRKGLTIPLGCDTVKLCQLAGFEVFDIIVNKMYFPSFWQVNRAIKDQEEGKSHSLRVHEYVLVFRKP